MAHREPLWLAAQLLPALIAALFLFTGLGMRLRELCARIAGGRWFWTVTLFACAYIVVSALLTLPFDYYREIVDLRAWNELDQTPAQWLVGEMVSLTVRVVVAGLFIWIPYALIAKQPRLWWLYAALALVPVAFFVLVALPVWVDPLTTSYTPLADKTLEAKIETLAARCGVPHIPVFIGGDDDTAIGLGPTKRVILDKDIFKKETTDQIEFTVGHELKHYIEGDNWKALAIIAFFMLLGFFLADRIGRFLIARFSSCSASMISRIPRHFPLIVLSSASFGWPYCRDSIFLRGTSSTKPTVSASNSHTRTMRRQPWSRAGPRTICAMSNGTASRRSSPRPIPPMPTVSASPTPIAPGQKASRSSMAMSASLLPRHDIDASRKPAWRG